MKLLLPVVSSDDIIRFSEISENIEFYAGITSDEWYNKFGAYEDLNRMSSFGNNANMRSMEEVRKLCDTAEGKELYITLNSACYSMEQEKYLDNIIAELSEMRITGIIAGDYNIVGIIKKYSLKAVASTMTGIYNADIARFCVDIGFDRLILPRDLTLEEIKEIVEAVPDVEYECFLMRNGCRYSDSNCLARHSGRCGAICTYLDNSRVSYMGEAEKNFSVHDSAVFSHLAFSQVYQKSACGMCAIWDLHQIGVTAGKIVGRADGAGSIISDLNCLEKNIKIADEAESRDEYLKKMIMPKNYDSICFKACNCYYPEVRF